MWTKIEQVADRVPSKRSGHTLTALGTSAYLFGGTELKSPPGPNNDLYSVDLIPRGTSLCLLESRACMALPLCTCWRGM